VVLGARAHHCRPADVDLLDDLGWCRTARRGRGKGIEIDHEQLERADAEAVHGLDVRRIRRVGQQTGVHMGVQRLDSSAEDLGKPGDLLDRRDRDAELADPGRGGAG